MKNLIFKLNCKVEKGKRNDEMTRESKSKAYFSKIAKRRIFLCFAGSSVINVTVVVYCSDLFRTK